MRMNPNLTEEYDHGSYGNLRVEILGFSHNPETIKHFPERTEPEPFKMLPAVEQDAPDVAEAFLEVAPVEDCDLDLPAEEPEEGNLPDLEESTLHYITL